jgi:hypothetical protein
VHSVYVSKIETHALVYGKKTSIYISKILIESTKHWARAAQVGPNIDRCIMEIKEALATATLLAHPRPHALTIDASYTDASDTAVGA